MGGGSPPPTPNGYAIAAAQATANISVAVSQTVLNNADVIAPNGTTTFAQTGSYNIADPQYDTSGNLTGTTTRTIPRWTQTIRLTEKGQSIFDANQDLQLASNQIAASQVTKLQTTLGTVFDGSGLPAMAQGPAAGTLNGTITSPRAVQQAIGSDTSTEREAAIAAVISRLEFQTNINRDARITALANKGIFAGSEAYENEMRPFDFAATDGRLQAILAGGQEQTRIFAIERSKGEFYNAAQEQDFRQGHIIVDFSNTVALRRFQMLTQVADFINTYRERYLQEMLAIRNQEINEFSTLKTGGQIAIPAFTGFKAGHIDATPLADSVYKSAQIAQQNYQNKVDQQNALVGGIASLVGGIALAPMTGGGSLFGSLVGGSKMLSPGGG